DLGDTVGRLVADVAVPGVDHRPLGAGADLPTRILLGGALARGVHGRLHSWSDHSYECRTVARLVPAPRRVGTLPVIAVPRDLRPMLATPSKALPVDDGSWAYEMKWDGMRALVGIEAGSVWLTSRAGNDATARFPEIAPIAEALGGVDALLDGELVALDEGGVPSFEKLQPRTQAHGRTAIEKGMATQPVVL